jgi:hypothetical protein
VRGGPRCRGKLEAICVCPGKTAQITAVAFTDTRHEEAHVCCGSALCRNDTGTQHESKQCSYHACFVHNGFLLLKCNKATIGPVISPRNTRTYATDDLLRVNGAPGIKPEPRPLNKIGLKAVLGLGLSRSEDNNDSINYCRFHWNTTSELHADCTLK